MSEQVEEIRCRLCATYFPETSRFCPNCREPRPDIHEDLLMASRLTGVPYEILLQRAWAEDGVIRTRPPTGEPAAAGRAPDTGRESSFIRRLMDRWDSATAGCLVLMGILLVAVVAIVLVFVTRGSLGGDDPGEQAFETTGTVQPTATLPPATGESGAQPVGNGSGSPPDSTPVTHLLILNPAVPARFTDGMQVRLIATNPSVLAEDELATPPAGLRIAAYQIEVCAGSEPLASGPDNWRLEMPDGSRIRPMTPVALPELAATQLERNDCNSGWLSFEVPASTDPAYVLMASPSYEEIRFAWPG